VALSKGLAGGLGTPWNLDEAMSLCGCIRYP
jgi:hypothetical protein